MNAHDLIHRHREHTERIFLAQVILGGERKAREVGEGFQIARVNTGRVELLTVVRNVLISVVHGLLEPRELQRAQLIDAGLFDRFDLIESAYENPAKWLRQMRIY